MASPLADRELLVEALAVHLGLVARADMDRVVAGRAAAGTAAGTLVADLAGRGLADRDGLAALDSFAGALLDRRRGDVRRCLDDLSSFARVRAELGLDRQLAALASRHPTSAPAAAARAGARDEGRRGHGRANGDAPEAAFAPGFPRLEPEEDDEDEAAPAPPGGEGDPAGDDFELHPGLGEASGGRFRVLHAHARGGIGVVSVAFDGELQREVALKQIKAENADDPSSRARFLLEAEVTGRLEHPGIVPVYGLGFDDAGRPYYAMRFVRGITLEQAIAAFHEAGPGGGPSAAARGDMLELRALLGRFVSVCHTMAYAHSRNVLHRDLKPANILLGPYNETLVVDWGLAKVIDRAPAAPRPLSPAPSPPPPSRPPGDRPRLASSAAAAAAASPSPPPLGSSSSTDTMAGAAFGTPAFMSPEQAEGQLEKLGPASDVYSLGAVLYTLLCGRPPFESSWCEVTSLLARVKVGEFPAPRAARPGVPRPLEAVCLRAMARRPEDRYDGAEALAADIERWLGDEPVSAFREPRADALARWGRRHRPLVAGAAALLATAVVGLSLGLVLLEREHRETEAQRQVATIMSAEAGERAAQLSRRDYINRVNLAHRELLDDNAALGEKILYECATPQRGWEWYHVRRLAHPELDSFTNDPGRSPQDVWCLALSPDGRRLAAGSGPWFQPHDGPTAALTVRDLDSGRELFARRGAPGAVQAVAFSPDGRRLAAASGTSDGAVRGVITCHDAATGRELWSAEERDANVLGLAFSPDGKAVAAACGGFNNYDAVGYVRLYDAAAGRPRATIGGGPGGVLAVAYSPDGAQLATASRGVVDVWDAAGGAPAFQLRGHREFVYGVAFSPDGRRLASAGWDRTVRLWDRKTGELERTLRGHRGFVRGVSFSPDGRRLASCGEDRSVRIWDVEEGRALASFHGHQGFVHCVAFSPDGIRAASGSMDATVRIWPAATTEPQVTFRNGSGWVGSVAIHPGGGRVATAHNGDVRVWDPRTGEELWRAPGPRGLLGRVALAYTPDGTLLAAPDPAGRIRLRDADTGRALRALEDDGGPIVAAAAAPGGGLLAGAGDDGVVRVWDLRDGSIRARLAGHAGGVNAVCFSPDGRQLASASEDRTVKLWDLDAGKEAASLAGHATGVRGVAFAPDGLSLASVGGQYRGSPPAEVLVWDLPATGGGPRRRLEGHTGMVQAVAYSPDGRRLATASDDRTVLLWDAASGEALFTLRGHTSGVVSLAISVDGRQIVSGGIDCTARVWSSEGPEVAPARVRRRAAVELVGALFEEKLLKSEVIAALRSDPLLDGTLRDAALEVAEGRAEDAQALHEAAWLTIVRPSSPPDQQARAVAFLEAAARLVGDDPPRLAECRAELALAYCRADRPADALETLGLARTPAAPSPLRLAVLALASQRLGRFADAHAALAELRSLVRTAPNPDPAAAGFLREAEEAVHE
ncbi:Serine/threonine-protein kinase PrkC [Aquisphaera giovannonii]|uniref:Serine/threonine-protein kinase PrkC n=1 Tax=Aquisphaera giovannonii TaxID=406548 RepID=A0A5B9WET9_9BACT|nr:protein kinase [Aquisphaera giovannonii]QEH38461.1 Serine/threonine-protein kinase PrkC [Aquisphaera giovannonii]